jgi:hypothetical protein
MGSTSILKIILSNSLRPVVGLSLSCSDYLLMDMNVSNSSLYLKFRRVLRGSQERIISDNNCLNISRFDSGQQKI